MKQSIFIGFDKRHAVAHAVCRHSVMRRLTRPLPVCGIVLDELRAMGLYTRPTEVRPTDDGHHTQLWDVISEAPMSTEFAISRFLTPHLARVGLAAFMDCDILARVNLVKLFEQFDPRYAVMCVKHQHAPVESVKMDGQLQPAENDPRFPGRYSRKNWSSVMIFNCDHPANEALTVQMINSVPGRDLHAFCWLKDEHIGELAPRWNYLVGHSKLYEAQNGDNPSIVHWTDGYPLLKGYENAEYAGEFFAELTSWAK
jgi:hypothetical protein